MDRSTDSSGDSTARARLDAHYALAYEELRRLAAAVSRREAAGATLSPTALVHEAWLKLASAPDFASESPLHFKRIAARAMRQVLVEAARRRGARKRPSVASRVDFDEQTFGLSISDRVLDLEDALQALARISDRQAQVVEARFFGGLTVPEIAASMGVSEVTVMRDWRVARAWLTAELGG